MVNCKENKSLCFKYIGIVDGKNPTRLPYLLVDTLASGK